MRSSATWPRGTQVVLFALLGVGGCTSSNTAPGRDATPDQPALGWPDGTRPSDAWPGERRVVDGTVVSSDAPRDRPGMSDLSSPGICGNGTCEAAVGENCKSCPKDCGACVTCGDGTCAATENCLSCPSDCGGCCGNAVCDTKLGETCQTCTKDCGACCGDGSCEQIFGENCVNCAKDCGACQPTCGNGKCDTTLGESCGNCPTDCGKCCGNGSCDSKAGETCQSCPTDCGKCCGNGSCEAQFGETCQSCPADCGKCCGNGTCDSAAGETCNTCSADCGACCGNGKCDVAYGETPLTCPKDCTNPPICADLAAQYAKTLLAAKACSPLLGLQQCNSLASDAIVCGCPTHVSDQHKAELLALTSLQQQYQTQGCQTDPCPLKPCFSTPAGICVPSSAGTGLCTDPNP